MTEVREQLVAYLATLAALVLVILAAFVAAAIAPQLLGKFETFGLGTVTGGLIGVLRIPTSRSVKVDNAADDPIPTKDAQ